MFVSQTSNAYVLTVAWHALHPFWVAPASEVLLCTNSCHAQPWAVLFNFSAILLSVLLYVFFMPSFPFFVWVFLWKCLKSEISQMVSSMLSCFLALFDWRSTTLSIILMRSLSASVRFICAAFSSVCFAVALAQPHSCLLLLCGHILLILLSKFLQEH